MAKKGIHPNEVISPKQHWVLIKVLDNDEKEGSALALGRWDNRPVLAMRWNGDEDNPIGNPQSRGLPTWFVIPEKYKKFLLNSLTSDMRAFAEKFLEEPD